MDAAQIASIRPQLDSFLRFYRPCFLRRPSFEHFGCYTLGVMADLQHKNIETIALAARVVVRSLQEFLSQFRWNDRRLGSMLRMQVADRCPSGGNGIIDASGHPKSGDKTPGVSPQYCGQTGMVENCVVGQHLLFTDNHPDNPFSCMLSSDLFMPKNWFADQERCREAKVPEDLVYRPKWGIAVEQVKQAAAEGVKFNWLVFDEDYGRVPAFWFALDELGQRTVGEVPSDFRAWTKRPVCRSGWPCHAARTVKNLVRNSPVFSRQAWRRFTVKQTTRGPLEWEYKAARVYLVDTRDNQGRHRAGVPTDRQYWLMVLRHPRTGEVKYAASNAPEGISLEETIRALFSRHHVEKWFERAKQEAGLGDFEMRTYIGLLRHWLCVRVAMLFLAEQTTRLRGEKSADHVRAGDRSDRNPCGGHLGAQLAFTPEPAVPLPV